MAIIGNEVPQPIDATTQVYKATHDGTARLSLRDRSFISFMYGGKHIEDFKFIATIQNSRIQRNGYATFEDITTNYEVLDGQFYWGSHYTANTIDFSLATDEITEEELNKFKHWFSPGKIRELVLSESPNRALWARVAAPPVLSVLPFEKKIKKKIAGTSYETSITVYRGEASLSFIADEPYWHARANHIKTNYTNAEDKIGSMTDSGGTLTLSDKDFIKIIFEDGIPHSSMLSNGIIFGDGGSGVHLSSTTFQNLYYCGTAPARPTIKFTIQPKFDNDRLSYPLNSYSKAALENNQTNNYNTISIGSNTLKFTAPSLFLGYNQAIEIMAAMRAGEAAEDARAALRDGVNEYYARSWAMYCIEFMKKNHFGISASGALNSDFFTKFSTYMRYFLTKNGDSSAPYSATFTINCKTGQATGNFKIRMADTTKGIPGTDVRDFLSLDTFDIEKNVEDMVRSNYLLIDERNLPNEEGCITEAECSKVTTDYPEEVGGLNNVIISYQNLYL